MGTRVEKGHRVKRKLGPQWRLADIEIHIKRAECLVRMGDIAVSISNLLSVHPTCKEEEQGSDSDKQKARRDVGMELDRLIFPMHVREGTPKGISIRYV